MGSRRRNRVRALGPLAAMAALLVAVPGAIAHIERASYWPDPAADTADGQPTGGAVPEIRSLYTALDGGSVGETRVVCQTGEAIPYRADQNLAAQRLDLNVSRERVDRLERKLKKVKRALKKADGKKKIERKARKKKRVKRKLEDAKADYEAALQGELNARGISKADYERAVAEEMAARQAYQQALAADPSMQALDAALADAVENGYELRPSEPRVEVSQAEADALRDFNARLLGACAYDQIQHAVNDSGNNDRVVVMPGLYTEPDSRDAPYQDPACDQYEEVNDRPGGGGGLQTGANTYTYVFNCPNDQNLIAVLGREPNHDALPPTPLNERRGIPDLGPCIRCNLQLEGSGISPDDVVIDAGDPSYGDGNDPTLDPLDGNKDVGIRADRADGFVLTNMKIRHVIEHAIYVHEVDGYVNDRFKTAYAHEYGTLQFTSDHGLIQDCDTFGSGDAGVYPGSAPDTGEQVQPPDVARFNTEIRRCDMHHNAAGYSGTAANAVDLHDNDFYDNALGFTTDVFTAAGHPGFPQDSDRIHDNEFYSNNFNPYLSYCETEDYVPGTCSDVTPTIPVPVGTGMWIAGGNNNEFDNNVVWDNWRRGSMLFAVPDSFVCGNNPIAGGNQQAGCNEASFSTSHRNEFHDNVMSRTPAGAPDPNGVDFWWDKFPGNTANCWFDNVGRDGSRGSLNTDPPIGPTEVLSVPPLFLPSNCATSVGTANPAAETELLSCFANFEENAGTPCTWFTTPNEPQP